MRLFKGPCHYGRELPGYPFGVRELVTRAQIVYHRELFCKRLKTFRQKFIDFAATDVDDVQKLISAELRQPGGRLIARLVEEDSKQIDILAGGRAPGEDYMRRTYWRGLYTPAWTRPLASERPQNYKTIENGSYW